MLRSLTAKQFAEWEHYANLEPFDEVRSDYRTAAIVGMIHNTAVSSQYQRPFADFLLRWEEEQDQEVTIDDYETAKRKEELFIAMLTAAYSTQAKGLN